MAGIHTLDRGNNPYPVFTNNKDKQVPKMEWIANNWLECLAVFWMAEQCVKLTLMLADILHDIVWSSITKVVKK